MLLGLLPGGQGVLGLHVEHLFLQRPADLLVPLQRRAAVSAARGRAAFIYAALSILNISNHHCFFL